MDNFSAEEISLSTSKKNTNKIFAQIFSIKESLVKCDNKLKNKNFNQIKISFKNGVPRYKNFKISSSVSDRVIISLVIKT